MFPISQARINLNLGVLVTQRGNFHFKKHFSQFWGTFTVLKKKTLSLQFWKPNTVIVSSITQFPKPKQLCISMERRQLAWKCLYAHLPLPASTCLPTPLPSADELFQTHAHFYEGQHATRKQLEHGHSSSPDVRFEIGPRMRQTQLSTQLFADYFPLFFFRFLCFSFPFSFVCSVSSFCLAPFLYMIECPALRI